MIVQFQLTPATPRPLFVAAPIVPATCVPCQLLALPWARSPTSVGSASIAVPVARDRSAGDHVVAAALVLREIGVVRAPGVDHGDDHVGAAGRDVPRLRQVDQRVVPLEVVVRVVRLGEGPADEVGLAVERAGRAGQGRDARERVARAVLLARPFRHVEPDPAEPLARTGDRLDASARRPARRPEPRRGSAAGPRPARPRRRGDHSGLRRDAPADRPPRPPAPRAPADGRPAASRSRGAPLLRRSAATRRPGRRWRSRRGAGCPRARSASGSAASRSRAVAPRRAWDSRGPTWRRARRARTWRTRGSWFRSRASGPPGRSGGRRPPGRTPGRPCPRSSASRRRRPRPGTGPRRARRWAPARGAASPAGRRSGRARRRPRPPRRSRRGRGRPGRGSGPGASRRATASSRRTGAPRDRRSRSRSR